MARNSGVLIRQLLGNRNHPCAAGLLYHLHHKPIQNLTSVPNTAPSSPHIINIRSFATPIFQSGPAPNFQVLQQGHYPSSTLLSDSDSVSNILLSGHSDLFVIESLSIYYDALDEVKDKRMSAVFFFTAPWCRATHKWITPIFDELREQFPRITMFKVYMDQDGPGPTLDVFGVHRNMNIAGSTLDKLGIQETSIWDEEKEKTR
ncbi:thioredoxin O, mitochondrial-like [Prunus avium]|uniref:Thioredoxin O, mitochondrial-like n=1 Tax=Prunus avium TaxID=42229 RepID=A0A6P5RRM3_PRUAV|nr:thioredoxin O, mitochondrial-like [Prunus avium]